MNDTYPILLPAKHDLEARFPPSSSYRVDDKTTKSLNNTLPSNREGKPREARSHLLQAYEQKLNFQQSL